MMDVLSNDELKCSQAILGLYHVYDPEIGLNVVDLGLIYKIAFDEQNKFIEAEMTLTSQFCPMGESIITDVTQSLSRTFTGYQVDVNLTFDPPWSPENISAEGRRFLDS
ncbi:MAG TPA: metal-sulfur cluster assembly factor [Sphingobacteriaceae bacterium]